MRAAAFIKSDTLLSASFSHVLFPFRGRAEKFGEAGRSSNTIARASAPNPAATMAPAEELTNRLRDTFMIDILSVLR